MTTVEIHMKRFGRSVIALLLALFTVLLSGCGADRYPFGELLESDTDVTEPCRILIAEDASAEMERLALELGEAISDRLAVGCVLIRGEWDHEENGRTVFVGAGDSEEHQRLMAPLRVDGYLCAVTESGAVLLSGRSDVGTERAVKLFCEELLPFATEECLLSREHQRTVESSVPRDRWSLNGFELWRYEIVLPKKAGTAMEEIALGLQRTVAHESGYWLRICREGEERGDRRLLLNGSYSLVGEKVAVLIPDGMGVSLVAEEPYGASVAAEELCRLLFREDGRELSIVEPYRLTYERTVWSVATLYKPYGGRLPDASSLVSLCDHLEEGSVDFVMMNHADEHLGSYMSDMLNGSTVPSEEALTEAVVLGKKGALTEIRAERLNREMTLTVYAVEGEQAYYFLYVSGCISNEWEKLLPAWIDELDRPTVLILHCYEGLGELELTEQATSGLELVGIDRYTRSGEDYILACYAYPGSLEVKFSDLDLASGCRGVMLYPSSVLS